MSIPPKSFPRFVPTLTEVVRGPDALPVSVPLAQSAVVPVMVAPTNAEAAPPIQFRASTADEPGRSLDKDVAGNFDTKLAQLYLDPQRPLPQSMAEHMVHRVMQRVDVVLDQRLREAIALVIQEQTRSVLPRLREEIESVVRHAVYEAVADELASGNSPEPMT